MFAISPLAERLRPGVRSHLLRLGLLTAVIVAGASAIPVGAAASPPSSGQVQLFGVHPLHQGQTTLPGGHFNFALAPGESLSDGVIVENFSDHALDFHVYAADLLSVPGGGMAPAQQTDTMKGAGAWIAVSTSRMTIPARGQFIDRFSVTLPPMVFPGEHLGAIVAAAKVGTHPQGSTIEVRTALTAVITVPGALSPSARLGALGVSTAGARQRHFDITLSNTGNLLLTYAGSVEIYNSGDQRVATLPLDPPGAYVVPDGQVALSAMWTDSNAVPGNYHVRATVEILAASKPAGTLTSQSLALNVPGPSSLPVIGGAAVVLIILASAVLVIRSKRTARKKGV